MAQELFYSRIDLTRVCETIPIILCGNKVDVKHRQLSFSHVSFHRKRNLKVFFIIRVKIFFITMKYQQQQIIISINHLNSNKKIIMQFEVIVFRSGILNKNILHFYHLK